MGRTVQVVLILLGWLALLYTRVYAHGGPVTSWWVLWLVLAHIMSLGVGFTLRGILRRSK